MHSHKLLLGTLALAVIGNSFVTGCGPRQEVRPARKTEGRFTPPGEQAAVPNPHTQMSSDFPQVTDDGMIAIGPLTGKFPSGWKSVPPASSMRAAQFELAAAEEDDEPGTMAVFFFGPSAGSIEANLTRWYGQFSQPDNTPTADRVVRREFEVNGMKAILVHFTGAMQPSRMPGAPATPLRKHWMNTSAIVQTPAGPWFFKGTGPEKTMQAHLARVEQFLKSLKFTGA